MGGKISHEAQIFAEFRRISQFELIFSHVTSSNNITSHTVQLRLPMIDGYTVDR